MLRSLILTAALLAAAPLAAQQAGSGGPAGCRVRIDATPSSWTIRGYDPFDTGSPEGTFSVLYSNDGSQECRFVPVFDLDQPPFGLSGGTGRQVPYVLLDLTNSLDVTPRPGRGARPNAGPRPMVVPAGQSTTVIYKLVVASDAIADAGTLTEDIVLEAQDDNLRTVGGTRLVLGLEVLPSARIGLAGAYTMSNGHAVVSLGELRQGPAPVPLQLRVNSTGRYDLEVTSLNGGNLQLGDTGWKVPYSLRVGGADVDMSGTDILSGPVDQGFSRTALPIHFVIGDVANRRAGVYSDLISISVSAR